LAEQLIVKGRKKSKTKLFYQLKIFRRVSYGKQSLEVSLFLQSDPFFCRGREIITKIE